MKSSHNKKPSLSATTYFSLVACTLLMLCPPIRADWTPAKAPLMTHWAKNVSPSNVHPEYPRPQMVRKDWLNLNGLWEYAIRPKGVQRPKTFDGQILVPFPAESALSGVMKTVGADNRLWYRRTFNLPAKWEHKRILLHFGAVDWETILWVNGKKVGTHRGGYDPFTFNITDALKRTGPQEIILSVWDPTNDSYQPRGKQVKEPRGIWYTTVTGIWQTVWLEPVPKAYIRSFRITPDIDRNEVLITVTPRGVDPNTHLSQKFGFNVAIFDGTKQIIAKAGYFFSGPIKLKIENPKLWSPDNPYLYNLRIGLYQEGGHAIDEVTGYFGMRKIALAKDKKGITRLFLNNKPLFHFGPLDQGWWPDGLYTAPTDDALRYDIEITKKLGFNTARKHVKIEPARWYYWCDKLGLLVWQDMPSGERYIKRRQTDIQRSPESAQQFELELKRMIDTHYNHPSIVMWVAFNEGWGQFDTQRIVKWIKDYDPTRLVNCASGWVDRAVGDVHDLHAYPGPISPPIEPNRAAVLGEFGGLGLPIKGHTWHDEKSWGYKKHETAEQLTATYLSLLEKLKPLIEKGLAAAIYTQTTDVETEINGLLTYDRAIIKMDTATIAAANHQVLAH